MQSFGSFNVVNNLEFFEKQISENLPEGAINYYKTYLKNLDQKKK